MLCDICREDEAVLHLTWLEGELKYKADVCSTCVPPDLSEEDQQAYLRKLREFKRRQALDPAEQFGPQTLFSEAIRRFEEENSRDPNVERIPNLKDPSGPPNTCPRELHYARRLTEWVLKLEPNASRPLRLAARCQHISRWKIPRESYPMTRPGYLKWREDLKAFHAQKSGEILQEVGYPPGVIRRVQSLNLKRNLATDPEMQTLEDALCLVFFEDQVEPLIEKMSPEKVITAIRKSWAKMSPRGRKVALELPLPQKTLELVQAAIVDPPAS